MLVSLFYFFLAGLCEISGGYLVWLGLRDHLSWILGAAGGFVLFLYCIIPTFKQSHFHRVYATYGGIFIVIVILGEYIFENNIPDAFNIVGVSIALVGIIIIFYMPRHSSDENSILVKSTIILIVYTISLLFATAIAEITTDTSYGHG